MRFSQSSYSQSESSSPLFVSLVLDATSGVAVQSVVAEIIASAEAGDTATGKKVIINKFVLLFARMLLGGINKVLAL